MFHILVIIVYTHSNLAVNEYSISFLGGDGNILELDNGGGCTTLRCTRKHLHNIQSSWAIPRGGGTGKVVVQSP